MRTAFDAHFAALTDSAAALFIAEHGTHAARDHAHCAPWSLANALGLEVRRLPDVDGPEGFLFGHTLAVSPLPDRERGDVVLEGVAKHLLRAANYDESPEALRELAQRIGARIGWRFSARRSRAAGRTRTTRSRTNTATAAVA